MHSSVAIVVPTFNRPSGVVRLLRSLQHQTHTMANVDVVIVDDGSDNAAVAQLRKVASAQPFGCRVIATGVNQGPGPARNAGWRASDTDLVAFVDDDCVPTPGWLAAGISALERDLRLGVVQGRTEPPPGAPSLGRWHHGQVIRGLTPYFEACNIFYRRPALEVGGFGERSGRWGEDSAAAWAAIEAGWTAGFANDATVHHDLTERGLFWHARAALRDCDMVALAKRFPGYRTEAFWRPWAIRRTDAAMAIAITGLLLARRRPVFALATVPWSWLRRPSVRDPDFLRILAEHALVDTAHVAGSVVGAIQHRCLVI